MVYICIVPFYWGKGKTAKSAIANCRKAGGNVRKRRVVYSIEGDDGASVGAMGGLVALKTATIKQIENLDLR